MNEDLIEIVREYRKCIHQWNYAVEYYAKSEGISNSAFKVLGAIYFIENCTQKDIYERISIPKQTINAAITYFFRKGFIKLTETPKDRRIKTINFTEKGKQYADKVFSKLINYECKIMEKIGETELKSCLNTMNIYVELLLKSIKELD